MKSITLTIILSFLCFLNGISCCSFDSRTFTQMLLQRQNIIFYIEVIESFNNDGKCSAKIRIIESFFGTPSNDTIIIQTGQVNTATSILSVTGKHLDVGSKWIVYDGFTCNKFTKRVSESKSLDAELKIVRTINDMITNKKTSNIELFNSKGIKTVKGNFQKGIPHGNWKHFYENGALNIEENYKKGILNDKYEYNKQNQLTRQCGYTKAKQLSCNSYNHIKNYYTTGKTKDEYTIKNGNLIEGEWKTYYENGNIKSIEYYSNNKLIGIRKNYSINGNEIE